MKWFTNKVTNSRMRTNLYHRKVLKYVTRTPHGGRDGTHPREHRRGP